MASPDNIYIHLLAGGIAGTVGAVLTCPLEVVKTRLQSSVATFQPAFVSSHNVNLVPTSSNLSLNTYRTVHRGVTSTCTRSMSAQALQLTASPSVGLYVCIRHIIHYEGVRGLFKGLVPNLVGVVPSRAIYFFFYTNTKTYLNGIFTPETPLIHMGAAVTAGVTACTATNPIWFVKTRLQLDQKKDNTLTVRQCIRKVYANHGILGFYKGITASYIGVSETVIKFVIYEAIKAHLLDHSDKNTNNRPWTDYLCFMFAGATAKTTATCITYPHEVVRTRLREEGTKYRSLFQTFSLVLREEGYRGLYRGLVTQLIRQIPNTAAMMTTYELVIYLYSKYVEEKG